MNGAIGDDMVMIRHKVQLATDELATTLPKKIIFLGDSITDGIGLSSPLTQSYPSQLALLLTGTLWSVENYGITSTTILKQGSPSYWDSKEFAQAKNSEPNIVVIFLGLNDIKPKNWKYKEQFISDYSSLINIFLGLTSQPQIFLVLPTPSFGSLEGITDTKITNELIPKINQVASLYNIEVIDLHSYFVDKSYLFPDTIHPNKDGAKIIAQIVHGNIF